MGLRLMHKLAVKTNSLQPQHKWVPWIVINGKYRADYQEKATKNLLKLICSLYNQKPTQCQ